jgi:hypothetical protein
VPRPEGRSEVMEARAVGGAEAVEPFRLERLMSDQYPSVGILADDADGTRTRCRILVSWFSGLACRAPKPAVGVPAAVLRALRPEERSPFAPELAPISRMPVWWLLGGCGQEVCHGRRSGRGT